MSSGDTSSERSKADEKYSEQENLTIPPTESVDTKIKNKKELTEDPAPDGVPIGTLSVQIAGARDLDVDALDASDIVYYCRLKLGKEVIITERYPGDPKGIG